MSDKLEQYIRKNAQDFDDLTPSSNLWDKIEQHNKKKSTHKYIFYVTGSIASIIIVIFLIQPALFNLKQNSGKGYTMSKEMIETELYYNNQILNKKRQVFKLTNHSPEIQKDIDLEMAALDSAMIQLKADLKDNIANQEVIEAMIQNYRLKLQILEDILLYIEPNLSENETKKEQI